jgi:predicted nucleotidyltransferase
LNDHINYVIKQVEIDYDIKVLYACEAGSRAWGFPSKKSDYDVRFIYINRKNWYLSIDQKRDVIEIPKRDSISMPIDEQLDLSGWELTKALRLFRKSNPSLLEWLHSSIVYWQAFSTITQMRQIEQEVFSPVICLQHYLKMGKRNFRDCLQSEGIKIKKYINALRPILAAKWIEAHQAFPPIEFQAMVDCLITSGELKDAISNTIEQKMKGEELNSILNIMIINQYLQKEIGHLEAYAQKIEKVISDPVSDLDELFRVTLSEAWH